MGIRQEPRNEWYKAKETESTELNSKMGKLGVLFKHHEKQMTKWLNKGKSCYELQSGCPIQQGMGMGQDGTNKENKDSVHIADCS